MASNNMLGWIRIQITVLCLYAPGILISCAIKAGCLNREYIYYFVVLFAECQCSQSSRASHVIGCPKVLFILSSHTHLLASCWWHEMPLRPSY